MMDQAIRLLKVKKIMKNKEFKLKLRFKEFKEDWEIKKLGDVGSIVNGLTYSPKDINSSGILVLRSSNIQNGKLSLKDNVYVNIEKGRFNPIEINDILICVRNGSKSLIGKNIIITSSVAGSAFGAFMTVYRSEHNKFITQLFSSETYFREIHKNLGATINSINGSDLKKFKFGFPSEAEEEKIASFLSSVDSFIENLKQQKETLEKYKIGMMQRIFSQQIRFKDQNGKEFSEWEKKRIAELDAYISDGNYGEMYPSASEMKEAGVPFIRANNIRNQKIIWNDMKFIDEDKHSLLTSGHLKEGDILITTRGEIGMLAYVDKRFENANINAQICLIRVNSKMSAKYLLYYLSTIDGRKQFKELQTGSALKQLPKGNLAKIIVPFPALDEQKNISIVLSKQDELIESKQQQIEKVEQWKKGLLQQLFL